jgi:hypothetical protein
MASPTSRGQLGMFSLRIRTINQITLVVWAADFDGGCSLYELDNPVEYRLKLANHYLPPTWMGVLLTAPALVVPPSYDGSLAFQAAMCVGWAAWIFFTYRMEWALRRLEPNAEVFPRRAWLISACLGSHPLNYLLIVCALALTNFRQTAISLVILPAIPIIILMTFCWYLNIFGNLRQFINERLPQDQAISKLAVQAIAIGLSLPGAMQLLCLACSHEPDWIMRSWIPIGLFVAIGCLGAFRGKLALALAVETRTVDDDSSSINMKVDQPTNLNQTI